MSVKYDRRKDYYGILKIGPYADRATIRKAFMDLAKLHHPDKNAGSLESAARFISVREACDVLSDQESRARYNQARGIYKPPPTPPPSPSSNQDEDTIHIDPGHKSKTSTKTAAGTPKTHHDPGHKSTSAKDSHSDYTHYSSKKNGHKQKPGPQASSDNHENTNQKAKPKASSHPKAEPEAAERKESTKDRHGAAFEFISAKSTTFRTYFDDDLIETSFLKEANTAQKEARTKHRAALRALNEVKGEQEVYQGFGADARKLQKAVDNALANYDKSKLRKAKFEKYFQEHARKAAELKEAMEERNARVKLADLCAMRSARGRPFVGRKCKFEADRQKKYKFMVDTPDDDRTGDFK